MHTLNTEIEFFHKISRQVLELVDDSTDRSIAEDKGHGDFSTVIDIAVENLIVTALKEQFPDDQILAEEGYADTEIPASRIWLIDPICGTNNLGKGLNTFCTNIALVNDGQVRAACVVDHMEKTYVWSAEGLPVSIANTPYELKSSEHSVKVDIDFGSVRSVDLVRRERHNKALMTLINETEYDLISLNASIGFMYTAIGKVDGFICIYNHPWDIAAAGFLLQQQGGIITDPDGNPWSIASVGAIGAVNAQIHQTILSAYTQ